jgi:flagellar biosynthetic protein FliO
MMFTSFASVVLVFGALGGLLWLLRRWGAAAGGRHIEVVETVPLAAGKCLSVVRVAGRAILLATSNDAVTLLSELDPAELERQREQVRAAPQGPRLLSPRRWIGRASPAVSGGT